MELENQVILVDNKSKTLSPILRTLENYQENKTTYQGSGYIPATDSQIKSILSASDIDVSDYTNPLKPTKKKKKEAVIETDKEQIKEIEKND